MMCLKKDVALLVLLLLLQGGKGRPDVISREAWNARPPKNKIVKTTPFKFVIIHHSHMVPCTDIDSCLRSMKIIQDFHLDTRGWDDIAYNFLIGGEGQIFDGRGWKVVGTHAGPIYNEESLGICLIGNFEEVLPQQVQLDAAKSLIQFGIEEGYIVNDYTLYGHRDVRNTTCPGDALYKEIEQWPNKMVSETQG